jgi:putative Mn2+ efflux pump MntP
MALAVVWKYFTDNPIARWIAAAIVALLGWEAVKRHLKEAGRKAERQAAAIKQAQIKEAVTTRSAEIIKAERDNADAALTARNSGGGFVDAASVPDTVSAVLFRSEGRDQVP